MVNAFSSLNLRVILAMSMDLTAADGEQPVQISRRKKSASRLACRDIAQGFMHWRIWVMLSWMDIRLRYRRSMIGPFWLTISMAITIYTMGFLYGHLFHRDLNHYFPYLASGLLIWALISTLVTDGCDAFILAESYLKQIKLPYSVVILRVVMRNLIIFAHNVVVLIPIIFIFKVKLSLITLLIIPGLFIIIISGCIFGMLFAMLCARFRDVTQIITSLIQVVFFLSPIIWQASSLPAKYHFIVKLNPVAQYISLVRDPIMGMAPTLYAYEMTLGMVAIMGLITFFMFAKFRSKIIYWL